MQIDATDTQLLTLLRDNARTPVTELARTLGLARTTVQTRIERLEDAGVIAGYTLRSSAATRPALCATVLVQITAASTAELDATLDRIGAARGVISSESLIHLATKIDRSG